MREIPEELKIAETYRHFSDDKIAELVAEQATLTEDGRAALDAEVERRGLSAGELGKRHRQQMHREAEFDKLEAMRRKKTALYLLTRGDPKGVLVMLAVAVGGVAVMWLLQSLRAALAY